MEQSSRSRATNVRQFFHAVLVSIAIAAALPHMACADVVIDEESRNELPTITVTGERVAVKEPAGAYASVVSTLRYDPQVDLQSRGLAEGQADVVIRGGLFENTGLKLGAVTVFDPQTGHYTSSLPIDPRALSGPTVLTGIDNAVAGFNSAIATLDYSWAPIRDYREIAAGFGTNALRYRSLMFAHRLDMTNESQGGVEFSYAGSDADGSRDNGDHDFERLFARAQYQRKHAQTDVAVAYQDIFYGWPGAYTGFSSLPETDHTKNTLVLLNHRIDRGARDAVGERSFIELGAYFRSLEDDYDFDRMTDESNAPGSFDHKTRSYAIGLQGLQDIGSWDWRYGLQLTGDELVRSTDLTNGRFNSRRYATLAVVPSRTWALDTGTNVIWSIGATIDASNRDSNTVLPVMGLSIENRSAEGFDRLSVSYAASSQLPGYTALNSAPAGLFGGNSDLRRERANTLSVSVERNREHWHAKAAVFARRDDDLVDWTFASGAPFARQANAVDDDVLGLEAMVGRAWRSVEISAGYTYLDKDADYGTVTVDASYYALNFARHRLTAAVRYRPSENFSLQWDNELRHQVGNALRSSSDQAYSTAVAVEWHPSVFDRLQVQLIVDNLTNSNFQEFPGTPAPRRQVSAKVGYVW